MIEFAVLRQNPRFRRIAVASVFVLGALVGVLAWQIATFWGLPDVGDPFDVDKAGTVAVPDEANAFTWYRRASAKLTPAPKNVLRLDWDTEWRSTSANILAWVEKNRAALQLWRRGTEQREAVYHQPNEVQFGTLLPVTGDLQTIFGPMACLRASECQERGAMADAWGWYRAVLRSSRHSGQHGGIIERMAGVRIYEHACTLLAKWASDPRTDGRLVHEALDEVRAIYAATAPVSRTLQCEYLMVMKELHESSTLASQPPPPGRAADWTDFVRETRKSKLAITQDRARSRRVVRLFFANWLAECDRPPARRAKPAKVSGTIPLIYDPDPSAPDAEHALAPDALARRYESAQMAQLVVPNLRPFERASAQERSNQAKLVLGLAEQLYRRDHGTLPKTPNDLVGTYLDALPEAGDARLSDADIVSFKR